MEPLPKKRQRREGYYRYGDEHEKQQKPSAHTSTINIRVKSTPTRVFPNVPGFGPLTRSEMKQDTTEIEKQCSLASDNTDSEDDEEISKQNNKHIFRSIRPPCAPESTIFKKKLRYFHWANNPNLMNSDLDKYRNCVNHLQTELSLLNNDAERWEDNFKLSRHELSNLHSHYTTKINSLQVESNLLYSLLAREIQGQNHDNMDSLPAQRQLLEEALHRLEAYDHQLLTFLKHECEEKEAIPEVSKNNKRKAAQPASASVAAAGAASGGGGMDQDKGRVMVFIPPSNATTTNTTTTTSTNTDEDRSDDENILDIHSKLIEFTESWKQNGGILNEERDVEARYGRVVAAIASSHPIPASQLRSSTHSGCLENEREALLLTTNSFPEEEIRQHLRQHLSSQQLSHHGGVDMTDPHSGGDGTGTGSGGGGGGGNGTGPAVRGSRRRKSSFPIRQNQQNTHLFLTTLRTPQEKPLFLTPTSPFEDSYGGVISRDTVAPHDPSQASLESSATVENLLTQEQLTSFKQIPETVHQMETLQRRVSQSKACLQRGIRTLSALEKEKLEWNLQLEKNKQISMKEILETEFGMYSTPITTVEKVKGNINNSTNPPSTTTTSTTTTATETVKGKTNSKSRGSTGGGAAAGDAVESSSGGLHTLPFPPPVTVPIPPPPAPTSASASAQEMNTTGGDLEGNKKDEIPSKDAKKSTTKKTPAKKKSR